MRELAVETSLSAILARGNVEAGFRAASPEDAVDQLLRPVLLAEGFSPEAAGAALSGNPEPRAFRLDGVRRGRPPPRAGRRPRTDRRRARRQRLGRLRFGPVRSPGRPRVRVARLGDRSAPPVPRPGRAPPAPGGDRRGPARRDGSGGPPRGDPPPGALSRRAGRTPSRRPARLVGRGAPGGGASCRSVARDAPRPPPLGRDPRPLLALGAFGRAPLAHRFRGRAVRPRLAVRSVDRAGPFRAPGGAPPALEPAPGGGQPLLGTRSPPSARPFSGRRWRCRSFRAGTSRSSFASSSRRPAGGRWRESAGAPASPRSSRPSSAPSPARSSRGSSTRRR